MKIGLSLSFCVKDIMKGKIRLDEVEMLVCGTFIEDNEEWQEALDHYSKAYWYENPEEGNRIAQQLWLEDRIHQPKLTTCRDHLDAHYVEMPSWHRRMRSRGVLWLTVEEK